MQRSKPRERRDLLLIRVDSRPLAVSSGVSGTSPGIRLPFYPRNLALPVGVRIGPIAQQTTVTWMANRRLYTVFSEDAMTGTYKRTNDAAIAWAHILLLRQRFKRLQYALLFAGLFVVSVVVTRAGPPDKSGVKP